MTLSTVLVGLVGFIAGGTAMSALQKAIAKNYAMAIHQGKKTLDDVKPQTAEYRAYVAQVYYQMYKEEL